MLVGSMVGDEWKKIRYPLKLSDMGNHVELIHYGAVKFDGNENRAECSLMQLTLDEYK